MKTSSPPRPRIALGLLAGLAIAISFPTLARAQNTVGIWDLTPWNYTGTSITTSTIDSTGPKVSGLSATSQSSSSLTLVGALDGKVTSVEPFTVTTGLVGSASLDQSFLLDKPVTFGPLASQSQFNAESGNNNGVGVSVTLGRVDLLTSYTLTLTVTGGGKFKSVEGTFVDTPIITGVGTQTVTLTWANPTSPLIVLDKLTIAGAITSFSVSHDWQYLNTDPADVTAENEVVMIISNAPPKPPVVEPEVKRVKINKHKFVIRGTCADSNDDVRYVEVNVGNRGFHKARGLDKWHFTARNLKPGLNKVIIRAVDSTGKKSRPEHVTIVCKG